MRRRGLLQGLGVATVGSLAGCAGRLEELTGSVGGPSAEEVKNNAETIKYDKLYRNIDEYEGEYVHYENLYLNDIVEGEGTKEYILTFPGGGFDDDRVLYGLWDGNPFKERDRITIWGVVRRLTTYQSLTGERSVPEVKLVDIELVDGA